MLLICVGAMVTLAGCASVDGREVAQAQEEKEYATGSNIPRRNRTDNADVKTVDPQAIKDALDRTRSSAGRGN